MRIRVANHEIEAMIVSRSESCLQTVVSRPIEIREVVDQADIRILGGKGQSSRYWIGLIEIHDPGKFSSMVANVGDVEAKLAGESMLDAQSPVLHVWSAEIAIHGEGVARRRAATRYECSNARRIDWSGLIHPAKA